MKFKICLTKRAHNRQLAFPLVLQIVILKLDFNVFFIAFPLTEFLSLSVVYALTIAD